MSIPFISADTVRERVPMTAAVDAIEQTLRDGFDTSSAHPRSSVPLDHGSFLLMPAEIAGTAGVKVASVAPPTTRRSACRRSRASTCCSTAPPSSRRR